MGSVGLSCSRQKHGGQTGWLGWKAKPEGVCWAEGLDRAVPWMAEQGAVGRAGRPMESSLPKVSRGYSTCVSGFQGLGSSPP